MEKERFCVTIDYTLFDVMQVIEKIRERAVVVLSEDKVCGVLSLGDIIKALSEGRHIYARIENLYNPHFSYLTKYDLKQAFEMFKAKNYSLIPVIDNEFHLVDVITPRDIMKRLHFK